MAAVPPSLGADLWDQGAQGSNHTHQPDCPVNVLNNPEGVVYADIGVTCCDVMGTQYIKTTPRDLATGWCIVVCLPQIR